MAAATATVSKEVRSIPHRVQLITLSSLTSDQTETLTHGGPALKPDEVRFRVTQAPSSLCALTCYHLKDNDTTTTCDVKVVTEAGGDIDGAEVEVEMVFYSAKAGGIG